MNRQTDNAPSCINPLATVEKMDRWKQKKRRKENLFFDCLVQKPCLKKKKKNHMMPSQKFLKEGNFFHSASFRSFLW